MVILVVIGSQAVVCLKLHDGCLCEHPVIAMTE